MSESLTKKSQFKQSPELLNGNYSLSKSEGDLFYVLLTEIREDDEEFKNYTFTKAQLEVKLGIKMDTAQLRTTARGLMTKVFEIYRSDEDWEMMGFSYFSYKNAVVKCRFDKRMKPYLLELSQYISADIRHLVQMKGQYSQRIYLLLKERFKFGVRKFNVEDLMTKLEVKRALGLTLISRLRYLTKPSRT
ncbi:MAG: replication initiation protein [Sulfurovum sp.]|nr:replication initiation protein [Sulfurovum sp.]